MEKALDRSWSKAFIIGKSRQRQYDGLGMHRVRVHPASGDVYGFKTSGSHYPQRVFPPGFRNKHLIFSYINLSNYFWARDIRGLFIKPNLVPHLEYSIFVWTNFTLASASWSYLPLPRSLILHNSPHRRRCPLRDVQKPKWEKLSVQIFIDLVVFTVLPTFLWLIIAISYCVQRQFGGQLILPLGLRPVYHSWSDPTSWCGLAC